MDKIDDKEILFIDLEPSYKMEYNPLTGDASFFSYRKDPNGRLLKQRLNKDGYLMVKIGKHNTGVHTLIGRHFFGKISGYSINHKNCNKTDNSIVNLEYITIAENIQHAIKNGLHVSCDPRRMPTYIDGRSMGDKKKQYKHEWYENKKRTKVNND